MFFAYIWQSVQDARVILSAGPEVTAKNEMIVHSNSCLGGTDLNGNVNH